MIVAMLPSQTVENYLKTIYLAQSDMTSDHELVPMGQLASALGVVPGTVAYVALGASAGKDATTFVLAGALAVLLFVATLLLGHRTRRRSAG